MRTHNGKCDECPLLNCSHCKTYVLTSDKSNVGSPDIFIVTNLAKNGKKLVELLTNNFSDKKYVIMNNVMCEDSSITDDCTHYCFSNFLPLSKKLKAKNCYIYDIDVESCKIEKEEYGGFTLIKDLKHFQNVLNDVYNINIKKTDINKFYTFNIPDEYYTDKYRLVDIQYISTEDMLIYLFRDNNNKKIHYEYPSNINNFYWYDSISSNRIIEKIDNLKLNAGKYKNRNIQKTSYGGDINICTQHCVDYYLKTKGECSTVRPNIMFLDIETYQYQNGVFPDPDDAEYPIVAISFRTDDDNDHTHVYLYAIDGEIDKNVEEYVKNYKHVTLFHNEITMLKSFFSRLKSESIDILTAWNSTGFDFPYIINRVKKLGIDPREVTSYGNIYGNSDRDSVIPGYILLDQLKLYKEFTHGILPSYSLNNVSKRVLGEEKVSHVGKSIDEMYSSDMDTFLRYSTTDTDLIYQLEKSLGHISLQNEIRRVATCSHLQAKSTLGQANGIYATQMKTQGLIGRNYVHDVEKVHFPGAYVFDPRPGIYDGLLCDFDFKSLYPTIICTWNIGPDTYIGKIDRDVAYTYLFYRNDLKNKTFKLCVDPLYENKTINVNLQQFEAFLKKYNAQITIIGTIFCGHDIKESINYRVLNMLMDSRSIYKKKMLNAKEAGDKQLTVEYNDKQLAFKIIANALYGALGQEHFRFYNPILGESITATGQEMLKYCAVHADYFMENKYSDSSKFTIDPKFSDKIKNIKNIVYGDTDSVFVYLTDYLKKKKLPCVKSPEVLEEVNKIQDFINKVIIPAVLDRHHVKMDKSMMYLKNEFLMNRYYALNAKKKYASRIIAQEGKDINEVDVKGLEIKRSEIPQRSQRMLREILDVILDEKNTKQQIKTKVDKIAKESKEDIYKLASEGDLSVAKVVSYSKKIEDYKVMPQHLLGMLTWNELCGKEEFKYGSKGKLFNVLGIDLNKAPKDVVDNYYNNYLKKFPNTPIESIVIPEGVDKMPDYFVIDMPKTVEYCCDDRFDLIMSGLYVESDVDLLF